MTDSDRTRPQARAWRTVGIFITGTFRDMHAERDLLMQVVFPELEERLRKRRVFLEIVDLRWGVETASLADERSKELQILRVCADEVERCRPFQVVLLGERYGSIPPRKYLRWARRHAGLKGSAAGESVSEFEINVGLSGEHRQCCRVYCREPLSPQHIDPHHLGLYSDRASGDLRSAQRLDALKARLIRQVPDRVKNYAVTWDFASARLTGLETFGRQILDDLSADLALLTDASPGEPQTAEDRQQRELDDLFAHHLRRFTGREAVLADVRRFLLDEADPEGAGLCLIGPAGCGKTALVAKLAHRLAGDACLLLAHSAGLAVDGGSVSLLLRRWLNRLAADLQTESSVDDATSASELDGRFAHALGEVAKRQRVVLLIDGLDQFEQTDRGRYLTWLPYSLPANVRVLATAKSGEASRSLGVRPGWRVQPVADLAPHDARQIVGVICARYHRRLNPDVERRLLARRGPDRRAAYRNPLWLSLAVEQLNDLDQEDFLRARGVDAASAESELIGLLRALTREMPAAVEPLFGWFLQRAARRHGPSANVFAEILALGRRGWRDADLQAIAAEAVGAHWTKLDLASLRRTFRAYLQRHADEGYADFVHQSLRAGMLAAETALPLERQVIHARIADYLSTLPADDPLRRSELVHHWLVAGQYERLAGWLLSPRDDHERYVAALTVTQAIVDDVARGTTPLWLQSILAADTVSPGHRVLLAERLRDDLCLELDRIGSVAIKADVLQLFVESVRTLIGASLPNEDEIRLVLAETLLALGDTHRALARWETASAAYDKVLALGFETLGQSGASRPVSESASIPSTFAPQMGRRVAWVKVMSLAYRGGAELAIATGALDRVDWISSRIDMLDAEIRPPLGDRPIVLEPTLWRRANHHLVMLLLAYAWLLRGSGRGAYFGFKQVDAWLLDKLQMLDSPAPDMMREHAVILGRMSQALRWEKAPRAARKLSRLGLNEMRQLVARHPERREWLVDLAFLHLWHGDAQAEFDADAAESEYRRALDLLLHVTQLDESNRSWKAACEYARSRLHCHRERRPRVSPKRRAHRDDDVWDYALENDLARKSQKKEIVVISTTTLAAEQSEALGAEERETRRRDADTGPHFHLDAWQAMVGRLEIQSLLDAERFRHIADRSLAGIRTAAQAGDANAQDLLAAMYLDGKGVRRDVFAALDWYRAAARQGMVQAQYDLSVILMSYERPIGNMEEAIGWLQAAAASGLAHAQFNLAHAYATGNGVERSPEQFVAWSEKAAAQGFAQAEYNLGWAFDQGFGVAPDAKRAALRYRKAAAAGLPEARVNLAYLYLEGKGVRKNTRKGIELLTEAARQRHLRAQHDLGLHYLTHAEIRDDAMAVYWLTEASAKGFAKATGILGALYLIGRGVPADVEAATQILRRAAAQGDAFSDALLQLLEAREQIPAFVAFQRRILPSGDDPNAVMMRELLDSLENLAVKDEQERPDALEAAARAGQAEAQYQLGVYYHQQSDPPDFAAAVDWYQRSADQGHAAAQYNLGYLHLYGQGVAQDHATAIAWIRKAANQGLVEAQYELGVFLRDGSYVEADRTEAAQWFERAAVQGFPDAQHNLGHLYLSGTGVPMDPSKARQWFTLAAQQGFFPSISMMMELEKPEKTGDRP